MAKDGRPQDLWARLRFSIVGHLLANPPERGELRSELERLSRTLWRHPVTGAPITFGYSTLERWYYASRNEVRDPVGCLRRRVRKDAGYHPSLGNELRKAIHAQYQDHKSWSYGLHHDNLVVVVEDAPEVGPLPSYSTVTRYMKGQGLFKQKRKSARNTAGAERAALRLEQFEVRSFESAYVNALWHLDFHHCSRKVLTPDGEWVTPVLLGVLDDYSRLACHLQWYLEETTKALVHGLCQAIQKRGLQRAQMTDNGGPMIAAETLQGFSDFGIIHEPTLPYSPYQNAKQEVFWASVEGRLMPMLEGCQDLTFDLLNEATQVWGEGDYNRRFHSEIGMAPIRRFLEGTNVGRPSPSSQELRQAFRAEIGRTQRKSDGTITLEGRRFEVPSRYRHLKRLRVRYARWDLSAVDLVDARSGTILCALYPLDKTKNADGRRRRLEPISNDAAGLDPTATPASGMAPLLKKLMAEYSATGLPPAYLPLPNHEDAQGATSNSHDED